jgi:hypothetical protein
VHGTLGLHIARGIAFAQNCELLSNGTKISAQLDMFARYEFHAYGETISNFALLFEINCTETNHS